MRFLGMNFSHEASIALIDSGALKFMQSEERLYRVKGVGGYPIDTLRHLLAAGGWIRTMCCLSAVRRI